MRDEKLTAAFLIRPFLNHNNATVPRAVDKRIKPFLVTTFLFKKGFVTGSCCFN